MRGLSSFQNGAIGSGALDRWRTALPDLRVEPDLLFTDGDHAVARWTARGTHEMPWGDVAASGKEVAWVGNTIYRIACGRIAEAWSESDALSFFKQIGTVEWLPR